jgi:hypothetical protein
MKPVETPDTNFTYKLPGGTSENDLPCERGRVNETPFVRSSWDFDEDEADLFKSTEGTLFVHVFDHDTRVAVYKRGTREKLPMELVSRDGQGCLYIVGAAGITRDEIMETGLVDLVVYQVPPPPVALWVQPVQEVEPEAVDGEVVAGRKRWLLVVDSPEEHDLPTVRSSIEASLRNSVDVQVLDMELLPPALPGTPGSRDPEELDPPDTKGA